MSRSPRTTSDAASLAEYRTAWQATMQLLRSGNSFSGHERSCVFLNQHGKRFANVSAVSGLDYADDGRALAVTDWDHDGDLDIWMGNRTGPRLRLMRNQSDQLGGTDAARFVSFRLRGSDSNRDAIGARIEIVFGSQDSVPQPQPLIQTLCGGDAFLSQSSKWVHFGLGIRHPPIDFVRVRWPNGDTEQFVGIASGHRYDLVEGTGVAREVKSPPRSLVLAPAEQLPPPVSETSRTFFANRLPLPLLPTMLSESNASEPLRLSAKPTLLVLWATWCLPCLTELETLSHEASELKSLGLEVVALSLDGLDATRDTDRKDARLLLERISWPWSNAFATESLLEKLEFTSGMIFNRQLPTRIPASLLIDASGSIAVAYRGPLDIAQLRKDLEHLNDSLASRRQFATPLSGRWLNPPRTLLLRAVAEQYGRAGFPDDRTELLKREADELKRLRNAASSADEQQQFDRRVANANFELALALVSAGDLAEAVEHFRRTLEYQPDHAEAMSNLGTLFARAKQWPRALPLLARAVELAPESITARANLAAALSASGDFEKAEPFYRRLLEMEPSNADFAARLGRARIELNDFSGASEAFDLALRLDPRDARSLMSLAWLQATSPVDALRAGPHAVELARRWLSSTEDRDPLAWDVLAAAQAECGDFTGALRSADEALSQSGKLPAALQRAIQAHRDVYREHKTIRDPDGVYP